MRLLPHDVDAHRYRLAAPGVGQLLASFLLWLDGEAFADG
jgi:hypothetical protein